ncbi:uncharacterized protein [Ambystoma mexicanum]|uniref:uncharacterized protein n=1 Tax=Ambystoma mexicanum TaxID=8296 RepID=UPI0037E8E39C
MSLCCCDWFTNSSADERQPISTHNPTQQQRYMGGNIYENVPTDDPSFLDTGPASSKRITHGTAASADLLHDQKVTMKLVDIPDMDKLFSDIAETFNEQHEHHLAMTSSIKGLQDVCHCGGSSSLTDCIKKLNPENGDHDVQLQMKGYTFSLCVRDDQDVPERLEQARMQVEKLSRSTKLILATETKLQEMIRSVLQSKSRLVDSLKATQRAYLDQVRVEANLEDNFQKVGLVQQKSKHYQDEAKGVLNEVAKHTGLTL